MRTRKARQLFQCKHCSKQFESMREKSFCTLQCYLKSDQFRMMVAARQPATKECLECHRVIMAKRKYCSQACYRMFMAKRFDRWMASPQRLALPQAYDEFLTQEELPCLIENCTWAGKHLGNHVNAAHGISARAFKKLGGFNLGTGLICPSTAEKMSQRKGYLLSSSLGRFSQLTKTEHQRLIEKSNTERSMALEGREHYKKGLSLVKGRQQERVCKQCSSTYQTIGQALNSKFCSLSCREQWYKQKNTALLYEMPCGECGQVFRGNLSQQRNHLRGQSVFCSFQCRNHSNAQARRKA